MKVPLISLLMFRHRQYNHLDGDAIGFISRWAIIIIIMIIIRGLIPPSRVLGFFVDDQVSIMSICWSPTLWQSVAVVFDYNFFCITANLLPRFG